MGVQVGAGQEHLSHLQETTRRDRPAYDQDGGAAAATAAAEAAAADIRAGHACSRDGLPPHEPATVRHTTKFRRTSAHVLLVLQISPVMRQVN